MDRWERFTILRRFENKASIYWYYNMDYNEVVVSVRTKDNRGVRMREPQLGFPSEELVAKLMLLVG